MKLTRRGPLNWSPITGREKKCVGHPSPAKERRRIVGRKGRCIARVGIALVQNPAIFCCQCTAVIQGIYNVCRL